MGDVLTDANDVEFRTRIFPKLQEFVSMLKAAGVSPFDGDLSPEACTKIRITRTPNGIVCPFLIQDRWTADYVRGESFDGIAHFGPVGSDNPFRAIGRADTNALSRLAAQAIIMPHSEAWKISERVADVLGIDPSRYELPQLTDEALFQFKLGFQTVRYRLKGTDPVNRLNYTRSYTLKATSEASAVLVRYSNLEAR